MVPPVPVKIRVISFFLLPFEFVALLHVRRSDGNLCNGRRKNVVAGKYVMGQKLTRNGEQLGMVKRAATRPTDLISSSQWMPVM